MNESFGTDADLAGVVELMQEVFPHPERFTIERLAWSYRQHPWGKAAVGRCFDAQEKQIGNYALIPLELSYANETVVLGLGVDLAVSPSARGSGTFRTTMQDAYEQAQQQGFAGILGIANAQSAPRMVKALGWKHLPSLATRLLFAFGSGSGSSARYAPSLLATEPFYSALSTLSFRNGDGCQQRWDLDLLEWRLSMPGGKYSLHALDDCIAVSTTDIVMGVRVAVLLKVFAMQGVSSVKGSSVAMRLVRHHKTPIVFHWGINPLLAGRGVPLPKRLQPSPLEVVLHVFDESQDSSDISLDSFELLDFDAY
ncbi:MAG: GNAT family N-acetyltransferase [Ilumatobacteraceae bacterium]|nr:GNAT family N-acetyltransferase [Ilumatobacteraceae bacterium]